MSLHACARMIVFAYVYARVRVCLHVSALLQALAGQGAARL